MFNIRKTKIVSAPVEEVLEVTAPEFDLEPVEVTVYNIDQLIIVKQDENTAEGELMDGNDQFYKYVWDKKLKRISSLTGERVDSLTWTLCENVLQKYYVKSEPVVKEEPVELKIAEALKVALAPIVSSIKTLETKIASQRQAPAPAPVQPVPRPQVVQSAPSMPADTPAINVADDDISQNAMRFLQQSGADDPSIDFMSL
jgi:hypothetical protein